jgi:ABC-type dipeptide/oligopeptide/nickel transport system ATPase subunit
MGKSGTGKSTIANAVVLGKEFLDEEDGKFKVKVGKELIHDNKE